MKTGFGRKWLKREEKAGRLRPAGDVEPASELLKRIRVERRKRWEATELDKLKAKSLTGDKLEEAFSKQRKKYKEPVPIDTSSLPELPEGWCWVEASELTPMDAPIIYGILQPGPDSPGGIPYIRPTEIVNDRINLAEIKKTSKEIAERYKRSKLKANDVLLSMVGTIGKVAIVPSSLEGGNITQSSVRIRPDRGCVFAEYIGWSFRSPALRDQFEKYRLGTAVPRLNVEDVRRLAVPLAPIEEQLFIIDAIKDRIGHIENTDRYVNECVKLVSNNWESVIQKAFRGELMPQDPNDEPASVLLERIREEKEQETAKQKPRDTRRGIKMKKKKDEPKKVLVVLRKASRAMTPEEVFATGDFKEDSVDAFYEQLRKAVASKQVREMREGDLIQLEAIGK